MALFDIFTRAQTPAQQGKKLLKLIHAPKPDVEKILAIIQAGKADLEVRDNRNDTPLLKALLRTGNSKVGGDVSPHEKIAIALIEAGAKTDVWRNDGMTPLELVTTWHAEQALSALIAAKADLNAPTIGGFTPLVNALEHQNQSTAKLLIEAGADINADDPHNNGYPLRAAVRWNLANSVRRLLDAGASLDRIEEPGRNLIEDARRNGNAEIEKMLTDALAAKAQKEVDVKAEAARDTQRWIADGLPLQKEVKVKQLTLRHRKPGMGASFAPSSL